MKNTGITYTSAERSPVILPEMAELLPPLSAEQSAALEEDLLRNGCYQLLCCQAKECRLTKRAYLARLIEGRPVKARPTKEIKELRTEIHHIGNNINQIARSVNAGIAKPEDAKRGLYLLDQVYELMFRIANK